MNPYDVLRDYINRYASKPVTNEEFALVEKAFISKSLKRRQFLLRAGEVCKYYGFVVKGSLRQYCVDVKGIDQVINFAVENWWIGDRESFFNFTPSNFSIDAMEDCELLLVTAEDIQKLRTMVPAITEMTIEMDKNNHIASQKRLLVSIRASAEERYLSFIEQYPDFVNRYPLRMIASFLGISTETLSRVRFKLFRKSK